MKTKKKVFAGLVMLLFLLLFVAAAAIALAPTASADPGWDYYRVIEIDNGKVSGGADLPSFPVLIGHTADWLKYEDTKGKVRESHGYDIVFTNADNSSLLDYEIEEYDGTNGKLVAWVKIPTLDHDDNTTIRLWYGNSAATDWSNPTGVWDTNYKMVQHLNESCAAASCIKDSTSNDNGGTPYSGVTVTDLYTSSGKIDGADAFDNRTDDYVNCGHDASVQITGDMTIEVWIKPNINGNYLGIIGTYDSGTRAKWQYNLHIKGTTHKIRFTRGDFTNKDEVEGPILTTNTWYHIVAVDDGTYLRMYVNGIETENSPISKSVTPTSSFSNLYIGSYFTTSNNFNGTIDEVRISASARSGDWIKTEYDNQNSPATFYEVKDRTDTGGSDPVPELPTIILFCIGLLVLAGYQRLERRRRRGKY